MVTYINNIEELDNVRNDLTGHYILARNLDFQDDDSYDNPANKPTYTTGSGWARIGTGSGTNGFRGIFDGNGYTIRHLYFERSAPYSSYDGLFGYVTNGGEIKNLGVIDVNIHGSVIGALAGNTTNCHIHSCYSTGLVDARDRNGAGGLIGNSFTSDCLIENCWSDCTVKSADHSGGFIGGNSEWQGQPVIRNCYAFGEVESDGNAGGFCSLNSGIIENSYSSNTVEGSNVGGFTATGGGTVTNCYWDVNVSGITNSNGGSGRTTEEMYNIDTYEGWNIQLSNLYEDETWYIRNFVSYPKLSPDLISAPKSENEVYYNVNIITKDGYLYPIHDNIHIDNSLYDLVEGSVTLSTGDTVPIATLTINNENSKYIDVFSAGDDVEMFTETYEDSNKKLLNLLFNLENHYPCDDTSTTEVLTDVHGNFNATNNDIVYDTSTVLNGDAIRFNGDSSYVQLDSFDINKDSTFSIHMDVEHVPQGNIFYVMTRGTPTGVLRIYKDAYPSEQPSELYSHFYIDKRMEHFDFDENNNFYFLLGWFDGTNQAEVVKSVHDGNGNFTTDWTFTMPVTSPEQGGLVLSNDREYVYVSSITGVIKKIDTSTGTEDDEFTGHSGHIYRLDISPDDAFLFTAGSDNTMRKFNTETGSQVWSFTGHSNDVSGVKVSKVDESVYSGDYDGVLKKVSSTGSQLWSVQIEDEFSDTYSTTLNFSIQNMDVDDEDNIYTYSFSQVVSGARYFKITKHNSNGILLWKHFRLGPILHFYVNIDIDGNILADRYKLSPEGEFFQIDSSDWQAPELMGPVINIRSDHYRRLSNDTNVLFNREDYSPSIIIEDSNKLTFHFNDSESYTQNLIQTTTNNALSVSLTYDKGTFDCYVDGMNVHRGYYDLESGGLNTFLGKSFSTFDAFSGNMKNVSVWLDRKLSDEEVFMLHNNKKLLSYDKFEVSKLLFKGTVEDIDYVYDESSGFGMNFDIKTFPELTDTTFTEIFINETGNTVIDRILQHYRHYRDIKFSYWNGVGWVTTDYDADSGISSWNGEVKDFPNNIEELLILSYQDERGWKAIKEVCNILGLDVFLEYDNVNNIWMIRAFRPNSLQSTPVEDFHIPMIDESSGLDWSKSAVATVGSGITNRLLYDYPIELDLSSLSTSFKDSLIHDINLYVRHFHFKMNENESPMEFVQTSNIQTFGIPTDVAMDNNGKFYQVLPNATLIIDTSTEDYSFDSFFDAPGFAIDVSKDGRYLVCGDNLGNVRLFKDKSLVWTQNAHSENVRSVLIDKDFNIYSGSEDETCKKLNFYTGEVEWTNSAASSSILRLESDGEGNVYVLSENDGLRKLSPTNSELWFYNTGILCYGMTVDLHGDVIVSGFGGGSDGKIIKVSPSGLEIFNFDNINISGSGGYLVDVDVDQYNNIYSVSFDGYLILFNSSGSVLNSYNMGTGDPVYSFVVDRRELRDIKITKLNDPLFIVDKHYINYESDQKLFLRTSVLDYNVEDSYALEIQDYGSKNVRSGVWGFNYSHMYPLNSFDYYDYKLTKDHSILDIELYNTNVIEDDDSSYFDTTGFLASPWYRDTTQYNNTGVTVSTLKQWNYGEDFKIRRIKSIQCQVARSDSGLSVTANFRIFYTDGTNTGDIHIGSPPTTAFVTYLVENPEPTKDISHIQIRGSRLRFRNFYIKQNISFNPDSLYINLDIKPENNDTRNIIGTNDFDGYSYRLFTQAGSTNPILRITLNVQETFEDPLEEETVTLTTLPLNEWSNIQIFFNEASVLCYKNGVLESNHVVVGLLGESNSFTIGALNPPSASNRFKGWLKNLIIGRLGFSEQYINAFSDSGVLSNTTYRELDKLTDKTNITNAQYNPLNVGLKRDMHGHHYHISSTTSPEDGDGITIFSEPEEFNNKPYTMSFFINLEEDSVASDDEPLIYTDKWSVSYYHDSGNKIKYHVDLTTGSQQLVGDIGTNGWHQVVVVYHPTHNNGDGELRLYIDEVLQDSVSLSGIHMDTSTQNNLYVGRMKYDYNIRDFRFYKYILSEEQISSLNNNSLGSYSLLKDTHLDVSQNKNVISISNSGMETTDIINRVKVYGSKDGENIITVYTLDNKKSQDELWIKDSVIVNEDLKTDDMLRQFARTELAKKSTKEHSGGLTIVGSPFLDAGKNVSIIVPGCKLSNLFRVTELTHSLFDEFTTEISITKKIDDLRDVFANKINLDDFTNPSSNLNGMLYSFRILFGEDFGKLKTQNVQLIDQDIFLTSGSTDGLVESYILPIDRDITTCEIRRFENEPAKTDLIEVTNNGGITWEPFDKETGALHTFNSPGRYIGFRINLSRETDTDPSPGYRSIVMLVK